MNEDQILERLDLLQNQIEDLENKTKNWIDKLIDAIVNPIEKEFKSVLDPLLNPKFPAVDKFIKTTDAKNILGGISSTVSTKTLAKALGAHSEYNSKPVSKKYLSDAIDIGIDALNELDHITNGLNIKGNSGTIDMYKDICTMHKKSINSFDIDVWKLLKTADIDFDKMLSSIKSAVDNLKKIRKSENSTWEDKAYACKQAEMAFDFFGDAFSWFGSTLTLQVGIQAGAGIVFGIELQAEESLSIFSIGTFIFGGIGFVCKDIIALGCKAAWQDIEHKHDK